MNTAAGKRTAQDYPVVHTDNGDAELEAAIQIAQERLPEFVRILQKHGNNPTLLFSLKTKFTLNEKAGEHMWLSKLKLIDGEFEGRLDNEPDWVKTLHMGDRVKVKMEDVSDWLAIENGKIYGGFTLRVLFKHMNSEQKKRFKFVSGTFADMDKFHKKTVQPQC